MTNDESATPPPSAKPAFEAPGNEEDTRRHHERVAELARHATDKVLTLWVEGIGPWKGSVEIAEEHLAQHGDPEKAIRRVIATHVRLVSGTGFLTGLGGLFTLPVALPADLTALWMAQGRLDGAIAHLRGYDVQSEEVRSVVLLSLIGASATEAMAAAGVQVGTKSAISASRRSPATSSSRSTRRSGSAW
ncbi:MAG: hypothetical protein Q4G40_00145 [Brachybacterium sp.]|nr:hypothetical protein [Brachybacterium sp.]